MKRQATVLCLAIFATSCALAADSPVVLGGATTPVASPTPVAAPRPYRSIEPGDPLTLDVYPRFIMAQSTASVRLRIEPDARSRSLWIEWDSGFGAGSHLIDLDGEDAPIRIDFPLKRLDAGDYEVHATLVRSDGTRVRRAVTLSVLGR